MEGAARLRVGTARTSKHKSVTPSFVTGPLIQMCKTHFQDVILFFMRQVLTSWANLDLAFLASV